MPNLKNNFESHFVLTKLNVCGRFSQTVFHKKPLKSYNNG